MYIIDTLIVDMRFQTSFTTVFLGKSANTPTHPTINSASFFHSAIENITKSITRSEENHSLRKRETHMDYDQTTPFSSSSTNQVFDAGELMSRNQIKVHVDT